MRGKTTLQLHLVVLEAFIGQLLAQSIFVLLKKNKNIEVFVDHRDLKK